MLHFMCTNKNLSSTTNISTENIRKQLAQHTVEHRLQTKKYLAHEYGNEFQKVNTDLKKILITHQILNMIYQEKI